MTVHSGLPELLAPAGSFDALKAAIAAGADAVYLSGRRFGARRFAANFDSDELKQALQYAHARGVSVYVTVNTLIHDTELRDVAAYLLELYECGADAVLVQDAGVAALAREIVPELTLHASTQMTIHNREGVEWAAEHGLSRVVLAREVPLPEIADMGKAAGEKGIGLEVFVHGALCYGYSGQCLLSSVIGGRSGNRGMCAQPCRKPYDLVTGGVDVYGRPEHLRPIRLPDCYLLSTRDLAVYSRLDRIVQSPVASLKIEGRMRSPEYVAVVTSIYRRALDAIAKGAWTPSDDDIRDLQLAFNRGFTGGYILESGCVMGRDQPGNRGIPIGTVTGYNQQHREATVLLSGPIVPAAGDGILVRSKYPDEGVGMIIRHTPGQGNGTIRLEMPARVEPGSSVVLNRSAAFDERAKRIAEMQATVPLSIEVSWDGDVPVLSGHLPGPRGETVNITVRADYAMEPARKQPLTEDQIAEQIAKTGGTPFTVQSLDVRYPGGLFAPLGELNRLRREFLLQAERVLAASFRPDEPAVAAARQRCEQFSFRKEAPSIQKERRKPAISVYTGSIDELEGAVEGGADTIYFEPAVRITPDGAGTPADELPDLFTKAAACCRDTGSNLIWKWPAVTRRQFLDIASPLLLLAYDSGIRGVMVGGTGAADAVLHAEPRMQIFGSAGLNVWNRLSVRELGPQFRRLTLSPELSGPDLATLVAGARSLLKTPELEILVQGNLEAMVTEDCLPCIVSGRQTEPFFGIRDRKDRVFPLRLDGERRTYIANAVETCLIDYLPEIIDLGCDSVAIDARGRSRRYAREMSELYRHAAAEAVHPGEESKRALARLKGEAKRRSLGGITAGYYLRGLSDE